MRDYVSVYWQIYLGVAGVIALFIASFFLYRVHLDRNLVISKWPETSAKILEIKFTDSISEGNTGTGHNISVDMLLRYEAGLLTYESRFCKNFTASPMVDYRVLFQPGHDIAVRYDPSDPLILSLYPIVPE